MKAFRLLILAVALRTPQVQTVRVQGTVTEMGTGSPLRGAQITLDRGTFIRTTATDERGRFTLAAPPGDYNIRVEKQGYFGPPRNRVPEPALVRGVSLTAGTDVEGLDFSLQAGGAVGGRILDSSGTPRAGATVVLMQPYYEAGRPALRQVQSVQTNERGEFRLFWVSPGDYLIAAEPPSAMLVPQITGAPGVFPWTYFPGTTDATRAVRVTVRPNSEIKDLNFSVQASPSFAISGRIANPSGSLGDLPPNFHLVSRKSGIRFDLPYGGSSSAAEIREGVFRFRGIVPDSYDLFAVLREQGSFRPLLMGRISLDVVAQDIINLGLIVRPPIEWTGRIVSESGEPLVKMPKVQLEQTDVPSVARAIPSVTMKPNGEFVVTNLFAGAYALSIEPTDGTYIADVRQDDRSVYAANAIVAVSGGPSTLELRVGRPAASIRGVVRRSESPNADVTVVLVPAPPLRNNSFLYRTARPGVSGEFELKNIAPGEYSLFAWDGALATSWLNAEFLSEQEERGLKVDLKAGEMLSIETALLPTAIAIVP